MCLCVHATEREYDIVWKCERESLARVKVCVRVCVFVWVCVCVGECVNYSFLEGDGCKSIKKVRPFSSSLMFYFYTNNCFPLCFDQWLSPISICHFAMTF